MSSRISVSAPSNIALVKYMGKIPESENLPENPSLSLTLNRLQSTVEFSPDEAVEDQFSSEASLSPEGVQKFLNHLEKFRTEHRSLSEQTEVDFENIDERVSIRSSNTFPHSAGIASSASSFAALTLACFYYYAKDRAQFVRRWDEDQTLRERVAEFSRRGSGSSCRSLMGPWVSWEGAGVRELHSKMPALVDLVLVVSTDPKRVGSSEAHARVKTSPKWSGGGSGGRVLRANERHSEMVQAIESGDFEKVAALTHDDFMDMHELFHTSEPSFSYWNDGTKQLLSYFSEMRSNRFLLTMDAGPNLHLIVPEQDADSWEKKTEERFPSVKILRDSSGKGAEITHGMEIV